MPLETPRLRIRPFALQDTAEIFRLSQEAGMKRFLPDQVYADEAQAADVLRFLIEQYAEPAVIASGVYVQAVEHKAEREVIGHVGLSPSGDDREIGYAVAEAHQGQGYATELVSEIVRWALEDQGLPRLLGVVDSRNAPSIRVLERAGFVLLSEEERALHGATTRVRTYQAE